MPSPATTSRLYPRSVEPTLDPELFRNPPSEYRGTPFWCWNDRLDREQLLRQLGVIQRMGFGGFHIHSRTGLATEYLGAEWMQFVSMCAAEAEKRKLLCWLYDEDRWPSGYAGGLATEEPQFRQRQLLWTTMPYGNNAPRGKSDYTTAVRNETGRLLARYEVELDPTFRLARYRRLLEDEPTLAVRAIWHAYIEPATPSTWFNGQTAIDALSRPAIEHFILMTHERYRAVKGVTSLFGTTIPAFFTDEPQFTKKSQFARGDETHDLFMPITEDFFNTFCETFGQDLLDQLPELFWNLKDDSPSLARYRYHEHTAERFASAFSDTLGDWCGRNGVALTGHMLGEANLMSQTRGCGEAMRGLRSFQLPGIDILCDRRELTTAIQARSIAHQFGREGVASELYGVTGWHFDFIGHKAQGDWQAAMGVTVRVPHLFWMSMRGEAKRDYPASIGEQSPWFEEYKLIEDHFARVATLMTRGEPATNVAVIHPIESAWLHWGPTAHNGAQVKQLEESFTRLPEWLLLGNVDSDYLSESLLAMHGAVVLPVSPTDARSQLQIGKMHYACVIVPPMQTIRSTTLDALERFASAGGNVIFAGPIPSCVDAEYSDRAARLAARTKAIAFEAQAIRHAAMNCSPIHITHGDMQHDHGRSDSILHQVRIDSENRHLFIVNTDREKGRSIRVHFAGAWDAVLHDTFAGTTSSMPCVLNEGHTTIACEIRAHGHLLLTLSPATDRVVEIVPSVRWAEMRSISGPVPITLNEPNVLLLDRARFRLSDDEPWSELTDILRIDNAIRARLGLSARTGRGVQPWADKGSAPHLVDVQLRFDVNSEIDLVGASLAMESPELASIQIDDVDVPMQIDGWWVDESIRRVRLPRLSAGPHELAITLPFTRKSEIEACYLLGDFGVVVSGADARIIAPPRELAWGDWTHQGLPFYGGNVTYHATAGSPLGRTKLVVPSYRNPLLSITSGGRSIGKIAFAPFELELPAGVGTIDITAFGNRANTFGPLHHADENLKWIGPSAWRTTGDAWRADYLLKTMGVLSAPLIYAARA